MTEREELKAREAQLIDELSFFLLHYQDLQPRMTKEVLDKTVARYRKELEIVQRRLRE